jgi:hypothetical protein
VDETEDLVARDSLSMHGYASNNSLGVIKTAKVLVLSMHGDLTYSISCCSFHFGE